MARGGRGQRQHRGGRTLLHSRDTDIVTATVTREGLRPEHAAAIFATTDQGVSENVRRDHRSRLRCLIKWLQENYPEAAESSTRVVTVEMKEDPWLYYFAKDEYDFMYSGSKWPA